MKKIRIQFLLFVYDNTQKLYRKYFKKKKRQWAFSQQQLLAFEEDTLGRKLGEFYKKTRFYNDSQNGKSRRSSLAYRLWNQIRGGNCNAVFAFRKWKNERTPSGCHLFGKSHSAGIFQDLYSSLSEREEYETFLLLGF